jgi:hypothetical protein
MEYSAALIVRIVTAAVLAVLFGNGSVVAFNRINPRWFEDYDENQAGTEPGEPRKVIPPKLLGADNAGRQRLPSSPWKYAFTGYFAITGVYLAIRGGSLSFEISVLCVLFIVLEMAIADQLYQVVPNQFSIMLAISAAAFVDYHEKWWEPAAGAALGFGISIAILLLGMLLFRSGSLGGADIKFFTCICLADKLFHYEFSHRGTAYIPVTYEHYLFHDISPERHQSRNAESKESGNKALIPSSTT